MPLHNCTAEGRETGLRPAAAAEERSHSLRGTRDSSQTREREEEAIHSYDSCISMCVCDCEPRKEVRDEGSESREEKKGEESAASSSYKPLVS